MHSMAFVKDNHLEKDHHAACSFFSYNNKSDVEIRFMEGTLDMNSIDMWTKFCLYFIEFAKEMEVLDFLQESAFSPDESFEEMCGTMGIREKRLINWLKTREESFRFKK